MSLHVCQLRHSAWKVKRPPDHFSCPEHIFIFFILHPINLWPIFIYILILIHTYIYLSTNIRQNQMMCRDPCRWVDWLIRHCTITKLYGVRFNMCNRSQSVVSFTSHEIYPMKVSFSLLGKSFRACYPSRTICCTHKHVGYVCCARRIHELKFINQHARQLSSVLVKNIHIYFTSDYYVSH